MNKVKHTLITAACVSLGSQLYINVFSEDFIIALAVVIFGICLKTFDELNPLILAFLTGLCSPSFRCFMLWLSTDDWAHSASAALPDAIFYFVYGIIYYFMYYKKTDKHYTLFWTTLVVCDAASNCAELAFMNGITYLEPNVVGTLCVAALIRASMIVAVCLTVDSYRLLLQKQEHEQRYKKLIVMAAVFNSEVYFMNKSIVEIEDVMKKAFSLYRTVEKNHYPEELKILTLDIAKDVHEIKKGYIRVIKGLQDNFLLDIKVEDLKLADLINILETDIEELVKHRHKKIQFITKIQENFTVRDHYMMMSILRNLVVNAVDAIESHKTGVITLSVSEITEENQKYIDFVVSDDGEGIREEDKNVIFEPGYSTKFDKNTGNINRGVGLTLVKDLVEERFKGKILVESKAGNGTRFDVIIPVAYFEEN